MAALKRLIAASALRAASGAPLQQLCRFSTTTAQQDVYTTSSSSAALSDLTQEERHKLSVLRQLVQRPMQQALDATLLTSLTACYRDLYVAMDQFHKKDILGIARPLVEEPPDVTDTNSSSSYTAAGQEPGEQGDQGQQAGPTLNHTQMFYPIRDLTKLPDLPPPGLEAHLKGKYMSQALCWSQLLPNHLEMSYQLATGIYLWPAMEAFYPFYMDVPALLQYIRPSLKLRRVGRRRHRRNNKFKPSSRSGWAYKSHSRQQEAAAGAAAGDAESSTA